MLWLPGKSRLADEQKITATNTWNFALIDYFADLTLLRNDEDQSKSTEIQESQVAKLTKTGINFQKASCTLDGCVKVWTSRVDSVATETGKLLSGLAGGALMALLVPREAHIRQRRRRRRRRR